MTQAPETASRSTEPTERSPPAAPAPPSGVPPASEGADRLRRDLVASVVVFLVALPLCLGVALASGAPLMSGIIAGIVGGLVVAPISGSALMVSGPAAGLTAIVLAAITELGGFPTFLTAVVLAGGLQVALGLLRAGGIAYYMPSSVIKGMLAAIGLILIIKQLPHAVGYDAGAMVDEPERSDASGHGFAPLLQMLAAVRPLAVACSLVGVLALVVWPHVARGALRQVPGALLAVVAGLVLNYGAALVAPTEVLEPSHLVGLPVPRTPLELLGVLTAPNWSAVLDPTVLRIAVTLAIVASLETLLSLEATDRLDPLRRVSPASRELVAQGIGNSVSGLLGGLPVTGVIVRSAANITAGARTRRSAMAHGVLLLAAVVAFPAFLNRIPLASLAAILLVTGCKLASPSLWRTSWRQGWESFVPFAVTVVAILFTDLLVGIGLGLAVAAAIIIRSHLLTPGFRVASPAGAVLTRITLDDQVTFLSKPRVLALLESLQPGDRIEIDGRESRRVDRDVLELLHDFVPTAAERGVDYRLVGVPTPSGPRAGDH